MYIYLDVFFSYVRGIRYFLFDLCLKRPSLPEVAFSASEVHLGIDDFNQQGESLELSMWDWPKLMHIRNVILSKKGQLFWISIAPWAKAQELQCQPTTPSGWSTRSSCIQCLWLKTHTRWTAPLMRFGVVFDHQAPLVIVTIHEGKNNSWNWVCHSEASHRGGSCCFNRDPLGCTRITLWRPLLVDGLDMSRYVWMMCLFPPYLWWFGWSWMIPILLSYCVLQVFQVAQ